MQLWHLVGQLVLPENLDLRNIHRLLKYVLASVYLLTLENTQDNPWIGLFFSGHSLSLLFWTQFINNMNGVINLSLSGVFSKVYDVRKKNH